MPTPLRDMRVESEYEREAVEANWKIRKRCRSIKRTTLTDAEIDAFIEDLRDKNPPVGGPRESFSLEV